MSAESFANQPKMPTRLMHHFDTYGVWGLFVLLVMSTVLGSIDLLDGFDTVFWVLMAVQVPYIAFLFIAARRHRPGLCGHCFDAFPLNPGEYAAGRARFALRTVHLVADVLNRPYHFLEGVMRFKILTWIVYFGSVALFWLLMALLLRQWFATVFIGALILFGYAIQQHRKLQIWCPWCDHGRGDDDDPEVEPEPDPADGINPQKEHA